jgi:glycosyltransferase 2 family protein
MRLILRAVPYLFALAFALWCGFALRGDLLQLSPTVLMRAWPMILLATLLSLLNYALRIIRWRFYLARLGHRVAPWFAALTFTAGFAYTVSPGKVGEMARARYYVSSGIPLSDVAAVFFGERLLDLVVMVVLAALLLTTASGYQGAVYAAAGLVIVVLIALAATPWPALAERMLGWSFVPKPLHRGLAGIASALSSTRRLLLPGALSIGFLLGLVAWALEGLGFGVLSSMFSLPHLPWATAIGIYGVAVLIGGLSLLPGGLGSTEAVMTALLATQGYPLSQAVVITLTCRLVTLWFAVVLGWLAILSLRQRPLAVELT